jgi:voltage-gated potassium channel
MHVSLPPPQGKTLKDKLWHIIFLADTPAGKWFDVALLWLIGASVLTVMLETVDSVNRTHGILLKRLEWGFTILFSIEYATRLWVIRRKRRYVLSFFGVVDLLSILPTYLEFFLTGSAHLIVIRILRMLRMFRILKMGHHIAEADLLIAALKASRSKIAVFLFAVLAMVSIESTLMYLIEGDQKDTGFTSIPQSIYWGIVTLTTVGYGDITPVTVAGKIIASTIMLTGFSIIAVPAGIVSAELRREIGTSAESLECRACGQRGHEPASHYCKNCGAKLDVRDSLRETPSAGE